MPLSPTALHGIVPAVVTPLTSDDQPDLQALQRHIHTLLEEGSHGILLLGTTGEGPSMGLSEREAILESGLEASGDAFVMVGTTTPSLRDTIHLTRRAYQLGADVVVLLPPYYYKSVTVSGLLEFYRRLFEDAVPEDGLVMLYHIPQVTQISISFNLVENIINLSRGRLIGIKDSSGDLEHARELCDRFPDLCIFVGTDRLLLDGLQLGAAGCITAGANVLAPLPVKVYDAYSSGKPADVLQATLTAARQVLERYQPFPATLKYLLSYRYGGDSWAVRPPLVPLPAKQGGQLFSALQSLPLEPHLPWLDDLKSSPLK